MKQIRAANRIEHFRAHWEPPLKMLRASICFMMVGSAPTMRADTTNLSAVADTFINSGAPNNNAGANAWFDAGTDGTGGVREEYCALI